MPFQDLAAEGVLESVNIGKWVASIAVLQKSGGRIRICANFSAGLNDILNSNQYPPQRPAE